MATQRMAMQGPSLEGLLWFGQDLPPQSRLDVSFGSCVNGGWVKDTALLW